MEPTEHSLGGLFRNCEQSCCFGRVRWRKCVSWLAGFEYPSDEECRSVLKKEQTMSRRKLLQIALIAFGVAFCLVYPLAIIWPSGWTWHDGPPAASYYFMMIVGIYATLGIFLIRASRDPSAHRSLIEFTIWSSVVHALIMAIQAYSPGEHMGHMLGDVPALLLVAAVLGWLTYSSGATSDT